MKTFKGKVWKYGDDVDTDVILPARYMQFSDPEKLAAHCLEDLDKDFVENSEPGDIIIAGENFGSGSSREHAPIAIKASGISCVIASSFARLFFRNSINIGLPIFEAAKDDLDKIKTGEVLEIDLSKKLAISQKNNHKFELSSYPPFIMDIVKTEGLIEYIKMGKM